MQCASQNADGADIREVAFSFTDLETAAWKFRASHEPVTGLSFNGSGIKNADDTYRLDAFIGLTATTLRPWRP